MQSLHILHSGPRQRPCQACSPRQQQQQHWQQHTLSWTTTLHRSSHSSFQSCSIQQYAMRILVPQPALQPTYSRPVAAAAGRKQPEQQPQQQPDPKEQQLEWPGNSFGPDGDEQWEEYEEEDEDEWLDDDEFEYEEDEEEEEEAAVAASLQIPKDQTTVQYTPDDFVEVGLISRPHGVRGEVKVQLITDEPKKRLGTAGKRLWLQPLPIRSGLVPPAAAAAARQAGGGAAGQQQLLRRVVVQSGRLARPGPGGRREEWAVKFEGVDNREQAATLAGHKLLLAVCDRETRPRGRDEFFIDQLVGLKVVDAQSLVLVGLVTEVYDTASSYSLLRVRLAPDESDIAEAKYRSVLVPFVAEMVPDVDVAAGQLGVDLPEGLLETASTVKLKRAYTPEQKAQLRQQLKRRKQQQQDWEKQQQKQEAAMSEP